MDNRPNADQRLLEAIEACRPGSDDLADPALGYLAEQLQGDSRLMEYYERVQQTDAKIAAAFCDVPVPDGLRGRILDRLAAAKDDLPVVEPAAVVKRRSRRWFLNASIGVTVAAAAVIVAVALWPVEPPLSSSRIKQLAIEAFNKDWKDTQWPQGRAMSDGAPRENFPISRYVIAPSQWRRVEFLQSQGVAYDMVVGARTATLYVVRYKLPGLRTTPARGSELGTAGCVTSAWSNGGLLYVLVVRGGERDYELFVPPGYLT